jgi:hypothetical protein
MDDDTRLRGRTGSSANDDEIWFEPKRFGYGAGLPIAREGWIALGGYVGAMLLMASALGPLAEINPLYMLAVAAVMAGLTIWFMPLCARHTRGGWRWRWGEKD